MFPAVHGVLASQAAAFDPDALTLFAAMTTQPDTARKTLISDTIVALKAAGVWSLLDAVWFMAAHDEQASRLNWKAPASFTLAQQGVITFTSDRGWQGDGLSGYLDTGWIPATHGVNYALNDASLGVYIRTNTAVDGVDIGVWSNSSLRRSFVTARTSTDSSRAVINSSSDFPRTAIANSRGMSAARRIPTTAQQLVKNGVIVGTSTQAVTDLPTAIVYIGARNNNGPADLLSQNQIALAFTGAAMSEAQQLALYNTTQTYMTAVGAQV